MTRPAGWVTDVRVERQTVIVDLGKPRRIVSSAPCGGGMRRARYVLNHQVAATMPAGARPPSCAPAAVARYLGRIASTRGIEGSVVAMMTAVCVDDMVMVRAEHETVWVEGVVTVGVSNAVRAGESIDAQVRECAGTINVLVRTNARLSASGMVTLVQVVTEAKAGALMEAGVHSQTRRCLATGTGTDATVVVSGDGRPVQYCGTHTKIGEMVGAVVAAGVKEGLHRYRRRARLTSTRPAAKRIRT